MELTVTLKDSVHFAFVNEVLHEVIFEAHRESREIADVFALYVHCAPTGRADSHNGRGGIRHDTALVDERFDVVAAPDQTLVFDFSEDVAA